MRVPVIAAPEVEPVPPPRAVAPRVAAPEPVAPTADAGIWARVVRSPGTSPIIRAILTNSGLVELMDDAAVISCPPRFSAGARAKLPEIAAVFQRELGRAVAVSIREDGPVPSVEGEGAKADQDAANPADDPLVKLAAELFGARIVAVQPRAKDG